MSPNASWQGRIESRDFPQFATALTVVAEHFRTELSERLIELYFRALSTHPLNAVIAAVEVATKTARFFPVIAEILDAIEGPLEDRAVEQFNALLARARGHPHPPIDAAAVGAIEAIGGWKEINWLTFRDCPSVDHAVIRRNFLDAYRIAVKRTEPRWALEPGKLPRALTG